MTPAPTYFGSKLDGLPVAGDGRDPLARLLPRLAQVVVGLGVRRIELDGLAEADDGRVVIPLEIEQNVAQVVVGGGMLRGELDGLPVAAEASPPGPSRFSARPGRRGPGIFRGSLAALRKQTMAGS